MGAEQTVIQAPKCLRASNKWSIRMFRIGLSIAVFIALVLVAQEGLSDRWSNQTRAATPTPETLIEAPALPRGSLLNSPAIHLVKVAEGVADPVNVAAPPDSSGRLFVVERFGSVRIIDAAGNLLEEPFLDLSATVQSDFLEQGLLGLAFHPNYAANGRFFVDFTDRRTNGDTFLMEYRVSAENPNKADRKSGRLLLTVDQPFQNHNGGTIRFGPDGYLYIAVGDGGASGDPYDNAQDRASLLGKLLRIDVDADGALPYAIPPDNPFAERGRSESRSAPGRYRPEIWAYGLRNPWQFTFDPETGDLYATDVGQHAWEEVNFQAADAGGGQNYGWNLMEGFHCYPRDDAECGSLQLGVLPAAEYSHDDGSCAVTGVGVYRGELSPSLEGIYFNADFCSGKIWGLARSEGAWVYQELLDTALLITGSGQDGDGELYLTTCECAVERYRDPFQDPRGAIWRLVALDRIPEGAETAPLGVLETTLSAPLRDPVGDESTGTPEPRKKRDRRAGKAPAPVTVESVDIYFEPTEVTIPANTDVPFTLPNDGAAAHNFSIDELGISIDQAPGSTEETVINAPPGTYEYYCNVPGHKAAGMVGTLTVE